MKIEKLSENQIRCTLESSDLVERHINLSELAYGSDKAKALFQEMMQQAFNDFGFDVQDNPLMVEAIPVSGDSLILLITKVEDPEELDTRFSKFSPMSDDDLFLEEEKAPKLEGADFLKTLQEEKEESGERTEAKSARIFEFHSLDSVSQAARIICPVFDGFNSLYKEPNSSCYYLVIYGAGYPAAEFSKVLNMLSEWAELAKNGYAREAYMEEHFERIIEGYALQVMKDL